MIGFGIGVVIVIFALNKGLARSKKMQWEQWSSYELLLDNDTLIRKQVRTPDLQIHRNEITRLQEIQSGNLVVKTDDKRKFIVIPNSLDGFEEVKLQLAEWKELEIQPEQPLWKRAGIWLALALFIGLIIVFASQSIQIVLPIGLLLILFFVWSFVELQRSPQMDAKIKRSSWFGFPLVIIIIGVKIFALLSY
jgi:hypothetical protein